VAGYLSLVKAFSDKFFICSTPFLYEIDLSEFTFSASGGPAVISTFAVLLFLYMVSFFLIRPLSILALILIFLILFIGSLYETKHKHPVSL